MNTGAVIVGSSDVGATECGPSPSMLNVIVSSPNEELAAVMASRRLQWAASHVPSSESSVELPLKAAASTGLKQAAGAGLADGNHLERTGSHWSVCVNASLRRHVPE